MRLAPMNYPEHQQHDDIIKRLISKCVVLLDNRPIWDSFCLLTNLYLVEQSIKSWESELKNFHYLCPVGRSGLGLATILFRVLKRPMIWIDNEGRVIPQTRPITGKKIAVIDSHSYRGAHFNLAYSRLQSRGAKTVNFFALVLCDNIIFPKKFQLPTEPKSLIEVQKHKQIFVERFKELNVGIENADDILKSPEFWGRS